MWNCQIFKPAGIIWNLSQSTASSTHSSMDQAANPPVPSNGSAICNQRSMTRTPCLIQQHDPWVEQVQDGSANALDCTGIHWQTTSGMIGIIGNYIYIYIEIQYSKETLPGAALCNNQISELDVLLPLWLHPATALDNLGDKTMHILEVHRNYVESPLSKSQKDEEFRRGWFGLCVWNSCEDSSCMFLSLFSMIMCDP